MSHSFDAKTFTHLTYCGHCKQLLWGLVRQGLQCKECGYACHYRCKSYSSSCAKSIPNRFLDDDTNHNNDSIEQIYFRTMQKRKKSIKKTRLTLMTPDYIHQATESMIKHMHEVLTSEKFQTILANAATNQDKPVTAYLKKQPPLNPQNTTKNFTRFVARVGPIFSFRDRVMLLLSWEKPLDTWISLIVYCLMCLYPKLLLFIPQLFLMYLILSNHSNSKKKKENGSIIKRSIRRDKRIMNSSSSTPLPNTTSTSIANAKKEGKRGIDSSTPASLPFPFSLFQPGSDDSPEYLRNLQNIQNSMGEVSDAYDWIVEQSSHIDWSSEQETVHILQLLVASIFMTSIIAIFVPLNMIFLSAGLFVYASNTRFAKYIMKELQPYMVQSGKRYVKSWHDWYKQSENILDRELSTGEVSVFENQVWTSDLGYIHDQQAPWSTWTGHQSWTAKTQVKPPKGHRWKQLEWTIDMAGPWVDSELGVEICVSVDKFGWVYIDDPARLSMPKTRRRRWIRAYEKVKLK
ncbi:hypothetical protein RMCBS344292_15837 [Rhizopus microsporus]|nr:hypothetical protein RMCBS344292_15226 [Rhizopus microsporus]CEJ01816.1 hypothetical protein RMCBS344292_15837 [Rhizopus microsporus]